jgi:hypothetical protein
MSSGTAGEIKYTAYRAVDTFLPFGRAHNGGLSFDPIGLVIIRETQFSDLNGVVGFDFDGNVLRNSDVRCQDRRSR